MHRKLLCIALALFAYPLPAQQADDVQDLTARGIGTEAVPGKRPGTRRYIVHFRTRSFDTCSFRDAIRNGESAAAVDAIVGNLKRLALRDQAGFRHAIQELGGSVEISFWLVNAASIEIDPVHLDKLRKMGNVAKVEKDVATYPLVPRALPFIKVSTDANHHNADAEFTLGNKATGLGVAIVDTSQADNTNGVGKPHQTYYRGGNKTVKTGKGIDGSRLLGNFQLAAQPANNSHPHGTGVASIAAGGKWNTAQADHGHAADADIIGYSICQFSGSCSSTLAIEAAGWQRVAADKVKYNIVCGNMSYGSSPDPTSIVQKAIDAVAADANVLPVTAAGNSGSSTRGSSSTANGIAVGATSVSKTMASFSSRGPLSGDTLRFFPDMAANGVGTVMARNIRETSNYVGSGTSMASPQVCGAAALVKNANKNLSAREIKALLLVSTEDISAQNPGRNRNSFGMGYLRDDKACALARKTGTAKTCRIASTVTPNTHTIKVTPNQKHNIVVTWYRHLYASRAWSDLNIRVLNGTTVVASSSTPRNLYEKVTFTAPAGIVTLEVSAKSLEKTCIEYSIGTDGTILSSCLGKCPGNCANKAAYQVYGLGCKGTGKTHSGVILPAAYKNAMAQGSTTWPHATANFRAQQVFLGSEAPTAGTFNALALRQDERPQNSPAGSQVLKITLGYTTLNHTSLGLTFASNWNSGTPSVVFNGTINYPALTGANSDAKKFKVMIPFTRNFSYVPKSGRNLLLEVVNTSAKDLSTTVDAAITSTATTATVIAVSATATKAVAKVDHFGVVACFGLPGNPGAIPVLSNTGRPTVGGAYNVNLSRAVASSTALLLIGASKTKWGALPLPFDMTALGAPGCKLLAGGDLIVPVPTDRLGTATLQLKVPLNNVFCGVSIFNQYIIFDKNANNLGLVGTNGGEAIHGSL